MATDWKWSFKMAWRDARNKPSRLWLFIISIILGVAALVAIRSFGDNLKLDIQRESKSLLGADFTLEGFQPPSAGLRQKMDSLPYEKASLTTFVSMAQFANSGQTRLVQVNAIKGIYPMYGNLSVEPKSATSDFYEGEGALLDQTLMMQFEQKVGDSIQIGDLKYKILGALLATPGRSGIASAVAPVVFLPAENLEATGLLQRGSRVTYQFLFKTNEDITPLLEKWKPVLKAEQYTSETVRQRQETLGKALGNMTDFLNLIAFVSLVLGCIGVTSSVNLYIKEKFSTIAVLRCMGTPIGSVFAIFLIQVTLMGFIGAIIGVSLGALLQQVLPIVLSDFLPIQDASTHISISAILQGLATGTSLAFVFGLLPLLQVRNISPLRSIRREFEDETVEIGRVKWLMYAVIAVLIILLSAWIIGNIKEALIFVAGAFVIFLILSLIANFLIWFFKKTKIRQLPYEWRQAISNLYRPNNQTLTLMIVVGFGSLLILTLFQIQTILLNQIRLADSGQQPNTILFDIQPSQKEAVATEIKSKGLPLIQQVPIVTLRLEQIDGKVKTEADTTIPEWIFDREYRCTYRDSLIDSETITSGEWPVASPKDGLIPVTLSDRVSEPMKAKIGTRLQFNLQGVTLDAYVAGIRKVDFNRVQTNFFVVFPTGVLEQAPQFHVVVTRTENPNQSVELQKNIVQKFPNISFIDLTQILKTADTVLNKVSFVIRFMATFSILTGLLVLIGSVLLSRRQRLKESTLLRTLGASSGQIMSINALEYFMVGVLAATTGLLLSIISTFLIVKFLFHLEYSANLLQIIALPLVIGVLTMIIGLIGSRGILNKSPMEVLRAES